MVKLFIKLSVVVFLAAMVASCSAPKNLAYFQDVTETIVPVSASEVRVAPHDKLSIIVKSKDPALSSLFNLTVASDRLGLDVPSSGTGSTLRSFSSTSEGISTYTVTPEGTIDFPVLGKLKIEGMTRSELAGFIKGELMGKELVKDPVVTVEFLNTGFSVMGEVNAAGRYDINKDQLNILEALSLAGDLTIQGQRENVAVVRTEKDGVHTYRVDLTNFVELTKSPAYYIKQGDVIYVEPNGVRKRQATVNGNNVLSASFWVSVASLLTSVAVLIFK
ncbi:MAG: polysaccharide biosynthesis/export family protein [Muribaculaceae bacterium]|nr:polysaccharide biosynthesis/export family protein [Muribaculaceae bacterium]MDE5712258.1 polysaccharide biosynthesis/export family protein [Muribaculaceae bacterium]